jgi:hypothetical protein
VEKGGEVAQIVGKATISLVVAAGVIASAPWANADDDSFVAELAQHGVFTARDPAALVALGREICRDLAKGASPQDEVNHFQEEHLPNEPTTQHSQAFVDAARHDLCPDAAG